MKTEHYYWKKILKKLGEATTGMKPINSYLKSIYGKLGGESTEKRKSNWYYLDYISENIGSKDIEIDWEINASSLVGRITTINIPNGLTDIPSMGSFQNLVEVTIPSSITSTNNIIFSTVQSKLTTVNLNWTENPVTYDPTKWKLPSNVKFIIPKGTTSIYENANYPSEKLEERE